MATLTSIKNKYLVDSDAYNLGVGDNANNIALLAFKVATQDALAVFNLVDGVMDEFEDEAGVDTGNSANESYDSSNDLYADLLNQLLGYQYEQLFGDNGELKGFTVKGNTILLNNEVVPISVLYDIINQLNNGSLEIIEVEVE